jgi:flagellar biosynthesis/type III secretory pathway protein FliH
MCTASPDKLAGMTNDDLYFRQLQAEKFQTTARFDARSGAQVYAPVAQADLAKAPNDYRDELTRRDDAINAASAADRAAFEASKAEQERILTARAEQLRNEQLGRAAGLEQQQREGAMQITIAQNAATNARNGAIAPASRESRAPTAGGGGGDRRKKRMGSRDAGPSLRIGGGTGLNIGV